MEGKKISFGFMKTKKPEKVVVEEKRDYIECVEEKSIKIVGGETVEEAKPLVIPMKPNTLITAEKLREIAEKVEGSLNEPEKEPLPEVKLEPVENETLEQMAVRELMQEAKKEVKVESQTLTVPVPSKLVMEGQKEITLKTPSDDPCEPYNPPVPDYSAPGRRISETKCYEYLWQIKVRLERANRETDCYLKTMFNHDITKRDTPESGNNTFKELKKRPYVIGGMTTMISAIPHVGAIGWKSVEKSKLWTFKCGCTLISPNFVITAAHCAKAPSEDITIADVDPKIVRFGVEDIIHLDTNRPPIDRNIAKIIVHPQYKSEYKYFDLALMQLDRDVVFTKMVQPACLWNGPVNNFKEATVAGWGVTSAGDYEGSLTLQSAVLNIIDSDTCDRLLKPMRKRMWWGLQDHQFCAGQLAGGVDACQGDSGGPLLSEIPIPIVTEGTMHYVIGVTSFGVGCARKNMPGVYTKLPYFLDWIESIVWQ